MSSQYISALVLVLVAVLPKIGLTVGSEELTSWIQAGITLVGGIIIMVKRFKRGDITVLGTRK